jgi:hypothetical protein
MNETLSIVAVSIALPGGPGTLSEIAFANDGHTSVIFLNSLSQLREELASEEEELIKIIKHAEKKYSWIDLEATVRQLRDLLSQPLYKLNLADGCKSRCRSSTNLGYQFF